MKFTSTRNKNTSVGFAEAILNCMPGDGGMYVPFETEDLRRWLLYTDEETPFSSIAGTLTSAFIHDEFSPIICETIATRAFPFAPEIKQLDESLFLMDLTKGPCGCHRDFGISFLVSCIETILQLKGGSSVFLGVSETGELGAGLAHALRGKKHIKAVILYPKGTIRGLLESDYAWNGGNIYPVLLDGTTNEAEAIKQSHAFTAQIFSDPNFVKNHHLTVANTTNIGRLLPQAFFYPFAFSRIKNKVHSDIFYALAAGNYGNLVAGLYAWQFALPLNGFIIPAKDALTLDLQGNPVLLDSVVPPFLREKNTPCEPSNLERLEDVFSANYLMMRHFVFPVEVSDAQVSQAAKELFAQYGVFADFHTSRAYAATKIEQSAKDEEFATVLIARDHPALSSDFIKNTVGKVPVLPQSVQDSLRTATGTIPKIKTVDELKKIIENL